MINIYSLFWFLTRSYHFEMRGSNGMLSSVIVTLWFWELPANAFKLALELKPRMTIIGITRVK